jgi:integrase
MASIATENNGRRRILFVAGDTSRKTVRLGKCSHHDAESIRGHIEAMNSSHINGQAVRRETAVWLTSIGAVLHERLAAVGLVGPRRAVEGPKLGAFIDEYLTQRADLKPITLAAMRSSRNKLVAFFGEMKPLADVTIADADAYRAYLLQEKKAPATVNKRLRYARHFFQVATRRRIIPENPFGHISGAVKGNPARRVFVPAGDVQRAVDVAPDPQWKLLITLARWGGLRIPSEALALKWSDVDFAGHRFIVRSSKTEHHKDGGIRVVPMFPELVPLFQAVFDGAQEGEVFVIARYRDPSQNLRTQLGRYIEAAGLAPWPKLWQNMRASRATELADAFPSHVCAAWLGHTEAVANEFYRMVTDEHFRRAQGDTDSAAHNPAQSGAVSTRIQSQLRLSSAICEPITGACDTVRPGSGRYRARTCDTQRVMLVL